MPVNGKPSEQKKSIRKSEIFAIIGSLCMIIFQMSTCLSLVMNARGLLFKKDVLKHLD